MPTLQIRDLPEEAYRALALRAEREHRSLAQQAAVDLARLPEMENRQKRLATLARIAEGIDTQGERLPEPEAWIREDRQR